MVRLRLSDVAPDAWARTNGKKSGPFGSQFEDVLQARRQEADEFYADITPASLDADAANVMRQALAGMLWSKQFYYYDVDRWLEERGSDPFKATRKAAPRNDQLAPHVQRRRDLDARQMGVPMVRGMGPGLSRARPDAGGSGIRQEATEADAARTLHAPERADSGVRMELRRRQSAGARLVDDLHVPSGESAARRGRQGVAEELLSETALEFHLVGQPQGSFRTKRF